MIVTRRGQTRERTGKVISAIARSGAPLSSRLNEMKPSTATNRISSENADIRKAVFTEMRKCLVAGSTFGRGKDGERRRRPRRVVKASEGRTIDAELDARREVARACRTGARRWRWETGYAPRSPRQCARNSDSVESGHDGSFTKNHQSPD